MKSLINWFKNRSAQTGKACCGGACCKDSSCCEGDCGKAGGCCDAACCAPKADHTCCGR